MLKTHGPGLSLEADTKQKLCDVQEQRVQLTSGLGPPPAPPPQPRQNQRQPGTRGQPLAVLGFLPLPVGTFAGWAWCGPLASWGHLTASLWGTVTPWGSTDVNTNINSHRERAL